MRRFRFRLAPLLRLRAQFERTARRELATAMGAAMATKIMGEEIALPVTAIREIPFHGLWKSAVQARVLYGRIRDALGV